MYGLNFLGYLDLIFLTEEEHGYIARNRGYIAWTAQIYFAPLSHAFRSAQIISQQKFFWGGVLITILFFVTTKNVILTFKVVMDV